jgi:hypothetical protein
VGTKLDQSRAEFKKKQPAKKPLNQTEFDRILKEAEDAIVCLDTDSFDVRQRMEPLLENEHLTPEQIERVKLMGAKLVKVLMENGFLDGWGVPTPDS